MDDNRRAGRKEPVHDGVRQRRAPSDRSDDAREGSEGEDNLGAVTDGHARERPAEGPRSLRGPGERAEEDREEGLPGV